MVKKWKKNTEKIIDFPIQVPVHLPYICHRNLSQFSLDPQGAHLHALSNGFRRLSVDDVLCKMHLTLHGDVHVHYYRRKNRITANSDVKKSLAEFFHTVQSCLSSSLSSKSLNFHAHVVLAVLFWLPGHFVKVQSVHFHPLARPVSIHRGIYS